MNKLIYAARYRGVPRSQLAVLDMVAQSVVRSLFNHAQKLYGLVGEGEGLAYGDIDYTLSASVVQDEYQKGRPFQRLRVTDHSSGWWADLQWRKPFPDTEGYQDRVDFSVFANKGEPVEMTLKEKDSEWGWGRCDMFWDACRDVPSANWSCGSSPVMLDFTHPLLSCLEQALEEHEES